MNRSVFLLSCAALIVACGDDVTDIDRFSSCVAVPPTHAAAYRDTLDPLPDWDYAGLVQPFPFGTTDWTSNPNNQFATPQETRLLAWYTVGPSFAPVDRALLWTRLITGSNTTQWALVNVRRARENNPRWWLPVITDVPWFPAKVFDHPPTAAEMTEFLRFEWQFQPTDATLVNADVRERTWSAVIGSAPTTFFAIERATTC